MSSGSVKKKKSSPRSKVFKLFENTTVNLLIFTDKNENKFFFVNGILVDECEDYYYLASSEGITKAVEKKCVKVVTTDSEENDDETTRPFGAIEQ